MIHRFPSGPVRAVLFALMLFAVADTSAQETRMPAVDLAALESAVKRAIESYNNRWNGRLEAYISVDTSGAVVDVSIAHPDTAVVRRVRGAVSGLRYTPAMAGGRPIASVQYIHITAGPNQEVVQSFVVKAEHFAWHSDPPSYDDFVLVNEEPEWNRADLDARYRTAAGAEAGRVVVRALIRADGTVAEAAIDQGATPKLDQAALAAVRSTSFKPAERAGRKVAYWTLVPLPSN